MSTTNPPQSSSGEAELRKQIYDKVYYSLTMAEADYYTDWIMGLIDHQSTNRAIDTINSLLIGSTDYDDFVRRATDMQATLKGDSNE